jgi:hypothetical protein
LKANRLILQTKISLMAFNLNMKGGEKMKLNPVDVILIGTLVLLVISEWRYRAKRDGKSQASEAMAFAGIIYCCGRIAQSLFGIMGLISTLVILAIIISILMIKPLIR